MIYPGKGRAPIAVERRRAGMGLESPLIADEATLHKLVLDYLRRVLPEAIVMHVPNGGSRNEREAVKLKRLGVVAGWPDLTILLPGGRLALLEVKTQAGKLNPSQRDLHPRLAHLGHPVAVVRSIEEARRALADWGVVTREALT